MIHESTSNTPKHIVIFSHGFGVLKDSRGLFTELSAMLSTHQIESVMFDYNEIDSDRHTLTVPPFSIQAFTLARVIEETKEHYPDAVIDLVCHSQGCLIPTLVIPRGIRKAIMLAPSLSNNFEHMIKYFRNRPGTEINIKGISKLPRRDGSITFVPAEYWSGWELINPFALYNDFVKHIQLTMVVANQDELLGKNELIGLDSSVKVVSCDGNHDFTGESRKQLVRVVEEIITKD